MSNRKPLIAVVIPAYNEENYIEKTIKAYQKQIVDEAFTIIVVNNNSTDKTEQKAISLLGEENVYNEKQQGLVHARRGGIEYVKKKFPSVEIILQADADVEPANENLINTHLKQYSDKNVIGVGGEYEYKDRKFHISLYYLLYNFLTGKLGKSFYEKRQFYIDDGIIPACGANMSYRINATDGIPKQEGSTFAEDFYLATKIQQKYRDKIFKLIDSKEYGNDAKVLISSRDDSFFRIIQNKFTNLKELIETGKNNSFFELSVKR